LIQAAPKTSSERGAEAPCAPPRISAIVCTYNRPAGLRRALASVLAQDIDEPFEVVVIDDGSDQPARAPDCSTQGVELRIVRTRHAGVGAARAQGLAAARGELIAWCDDDDTWTSDHLRVLRDYLVANPHVDLAYGSSRWAAPEDPSAGDSDRCDSVPYDGSLLRDYNYILASDVMHRSSAARAAGGFDASLHACEDWDLWQRMSLRGMLRHVPRVLGTHYSDVSCVGSTEQHWQIQQQVRLRHRHRLGAAGLAAQHDLAINGTATEPFAAATWRAPRRELICHTILRTNTGYGSVSRPLLTALEALGVSLTIAPTRNQPVPGFERFYRPLDHWRRIAFYYDFLDRPAALPAQRIVHYTMVESTHVPRETVEQINQAVSLLYVPCRHNVEVFEGAGVRVPVRVLPHGVDGDAFPVLDRPARTDVFSFGTFGELSARKGAEVLVRAFQDEFAAHEPVRLLMKTIGKPTPIAWQVRDDRIKLIDGFLPPDELLGLLRKMDAFVMPSRGEGFGLCGLEAMATGLPLIATCWSGPADYLDPSDSFPLAYELVEAGGIEAGGRPFHGRWAEPDYQHLRHLMRWIYEHHEQAAARGLQAARRVRRDWTWQRVAARLVADLDQWATLWGQEGQP
jgi:glycosyltransferase involved in cell wall biosynthesis/GT2 family glycosyltransferase